MRSQALSLFTALLLVAGCAAQKQEAAKTDASANQQQAKAEPAKAGPVPGSQEDLVINVGDRVFFDYDRSDIKADSEDTLKRQAAWLQTNGKVALAIEGHADERGTREYNLALGERRATAAKNYLVSLGTDAARLETVSYGKERPAVLGSNEAVWAQNRRAVSVVK
jgi:peptidoglycan-associated lipoprotein